MPLEQPIAKGANPRVRDATRWAFPPTSSVSVPPPRLPNVLQLPSGSPIDSEPPSSPSSDELSSPAASDDEDDIHDGFPGLTAPLHRHRRPASPSSSSASSISSFSKFSANGLLPRNQNTKGSLPSPALSTATGNDADGYFSGTFLDQVLPRSTAIADAIPVTHDSPWSLVLHETEEARVVYAKGAFEGINLRENLVDLLDLADEELDCDQVVVVLDKSDADLAQLLHSLMYVGGVVIPPTSDSIHGRHSSNHVLVGIDV